MNNLQVSFPAIQSKKLFNDHFSYTIELDQKTENLILNKSQYQLQREVEDKLKTQIKNVKDQSCTGFNDVEIDHFLNEFMDDNPEYLEHLEEEFDQEKIEFEIQQVEMEIFSHQFRKSNQIYDTFENKNYSFDLIKFNQEDIHMIPQITPEFNSFQEFQESIEYKIPKIINKEIDQFIFTEEGSKIVSKKVFDEQDQKSLDEVNLYLNSIQMAKTYPFELDEFQKRAIYYIELNQNVFVAAHTSAGKTVVAEYAIAKALQNKSKVIFTSPIKALSNQKYYEFSKKFNKDVGIITGDIVLRQESNCLIMTTEILRNKLYKRCETLENLEWVIFDEVHYINDMERGSVWEETIILLPRHVGIVMLSATVENVQEFADWVTRTTQKRLNVLRTYQRPVPLRHFIYYNKETLVKQHNENFDENAYKNLLKQIEADQKKKKLQKDFKRKELKEKRLELMEKSNQRERVRKITRKKTNKNNLLFKNQLEKMPMRNDKNATQLISMVKKLNTDQKLPAIIFVFSKKTLNSLAEKAQESLNLVTAEERKEILTFFERSIQRLKQHDKQILQIISLKNMLLRGIGVHHGDLLWICKEIVELLFQKNLLKLLFATESFAMGINVPTKSVIFYSIFKMSDTGFRVLKSGEYTQMCGRAGRRGIDKQGDVYIFFGDPKDLPSVTQLRPMLQNKGEVLESKFKLTYSTIINSFTMNNFKVKDLMSKSFTENKSFLKINALKIRNKELEKIHSESNIICDYSQQNPIDLQQDHFITLHQKLISKIKTQNENFFNKSNLKQLLKYISTPFIAFILDDNDTFYFFLIEHIRQEKNDVFFEGMIFQENQQYQQIYLSKSKYKKTKYFTIKSKMLKILYYEINFTQICKIIPILDDINLSNYEQNFEILENIKNTFVEEKSLPQQQFQNDKLQIHFDEINTILTSLFQNDCFFCEKLREHQTEYKQNKKITLEIEDNGYQIKGLEKSFGIDTFRSILKILQELNFMDYQKFPTINMKHAKSLSSGPEVILLTMVFNYNLIAPLEAFEIPVVLSMLCMNNKEPEYVDLEQIVHESSFSQNLCSTLYELSDIYFNVKKFERKYQVQFDDHIVYDLIIPLYEWCSGCEFRSLYMYTERLEGSIVRSINKIEKFIESLKYLYAQQKKKNLVFKLEQALRLLRRDILNVKSLYLS